MVNISVRTVEDGLHTRSTCVTESIHECSKIWKRFSTVRQFKWLLLFQICIEKLYMSAKFLDGKTYTNGYIPLLFNYSNSSSDLSIWLWGGNITLSCALLFVDVLLLTYCILACVSLCLSSRDFRDCLHSVSEKYCTVLHTCFSCLSWCSVSNHW